MYFSLDWYNQNIAAIPDKKKRRDHAVIFLTSASDFLFEECFQLAENFYNESLASGEKSMEAFGLLYMLFYNRSRGKISDIESGYKKVEELIREGEPGLISGIVYQMLAFEYWASGQRDKAFELAYTGSKISNTYDAEGIGWAQFQFGVFYFDLKDYDASLNYFLESERNAQKLNLNYQLARIRSGIGSI